MILPAAVFPHPALRPVVLDIFEFRERVGSLNTNSENNHMSDEGQRQCSLYGTLTVFIKVCILHLIFILYAAVLKL